MTHNIECPSCQQHIRLELPEAPPPVIKQPLQIQQPVQVTLSSNEIFKITFWVVVSLFMLGLIAGFGLVVLGGLLGA